MREYVTCQQYTLYGMRILMHIEWLTLLNHQTVEREEDER